ncbi:sialidase family protein [Paenibacillus koleovorans]|uniref:sialidase family protein n=1 Tax=Paenibacillus koleovorans TaxID=121608 RepID=UPI000FD8F46F|nr:sialidase family protein [Paenibacillus koleovorans]
MGGTIRKQMLQIPDANKHLVAFEEGVYISFPGVAKTKDGLVCSYLRSDSHKKKTTDIMIARSEDGGLTWTDHQVIAHADVYEQGCIYVVPRINALSNGRLVMICDKGQRTPNGKFYKLSTWVLNKEMVNELFWSLDNGITWDGPYEIDNVGGEPEYIQELSNGTLMFTRTEVAYTDERAAINQAVYNDLEDKEKYETMTGMKVYYQSVAVFSEDSGVTWSRTAYLANNPLYSDAEAGFTEISPGNLLAVTRCCDCVGRYGQPSRMLRSRDYGATWDHGVLAPFYGHRPTIGMLHSGKALAVFRNRPGTNATYAFVFDPHETFEYEPNSFIWDEADCTLEQDSLTIRTYEGREHAVQFILYPAQHDTSRVEIETELRLEEADENGCCISAGCRIRFMPGRICLADRPETGFDCRTDRWHRYRIIREGEELTIHVDGELKLQASTRGISTRAIHFGNAHFEPHLTGNESISHWRSFSLQVDNPDDYSIRWHWNAAQGYPDQFRRDRFVKLDHCFSTFGGDNGYAQWTQLEDDSIVILDYTRPSPSDMYPYIRSYVIHENQLVNE